MLALSFHLFQPLQKKQLLNNHLKAILIIIFSKKKKKKKINAQCRFLLKNI